MLALVTAAFAGLHFTMEDPGPLGGDFSEEVRTLSTQRAKDFIALTGHGMMDQAWTLQHRPPPSWTAEHAGFQAGLDLSTFPLHSPTVNLLGKEENTSFIPVLPKFYLGYMYAKDGWQFMTHSSVVPPLPVQGASAFLMGADISAGHNMGPIQLNLAFFFTTGEARAPVTATQAQFDAGVIQETLTDRFQEICAPQKWGCIDTLSVRHGGLGLSLTPLVPWKVVPYATLGTQAIADRFDVQIDATRWRVSGLLPDLTVGAAMHYHHLSMGLSALGALLPDTLHESKETPLLFRLDASIGYTF